MGWEGGRKKGQRGKEGKGNKYIERQRAKEKKTERGKEVGGNCLILLNAQDERVAGADPLKNRKNSMIITMDNKAFPR